MINYNLNSHLVLLAQFNQQNGRGSAYSKCEKTRNSNKYLCVVANKQAMHIHTGCKISCLFPSQHTLTLHRLISTATLKKKKDMVQVLKLYQ